MARSRPRTQCTAHAVHQTPHPVHYPHRAPDPAPSALPTPWAPSLGALRTLCTVWWRQARTSSSTHPSPRRTCRTGPHKLLKVVKNPPTDHLPPNCHVVLLSVTGRLVSMADLVAGLPAGRPVVFVAGAMAHGKVEATTNQRS